MADPARKELTDAALVLACKRGDQAAWEELVTRFRWMVYSIPRRAGLDEEQASDVFQRVFTLLVERIDRLDQPDRVGAWLVTTAKHETWRLWRRHATARTRAVDPSTDASGEDDLPDRAPLPDEVLEQMEEQHLVRTAVDRLDDRCRRLLDLLFYRPEPAPYGEVAAALGIAEGSVGPIRARCLERLRRHLAAGGY